MLQQSDWALQAIVDALHAAAEQTLPSQDRPEQQSASLAHAFPLLEQFRTGAPQTPTWQVRVLQQSLLVLHPPPDC